MIEFSCENCGQKFRLPGEKAGKKGRCPRCKAIVVVPGAALDELVPWGSGAANAERAGELAGGAAVRDVEQVSGQGTVPAEAQDEGPEAMQEHYMLVGHPRAEPEGPARRRYPWPIDVLLYPVSRPCLLTVGLVCVIPVVIDVVTLLVGPFWMFIYWPGIIVKIVLGLYFYWYLGECVRDSAAGGLRGPETIGSAPSLGEMFWRMVQIVVSLVFFFLPVVIYYYKTKDGDLSLPVLLALAGYAVFFFPMGLLAVLMFDSLAGLNPVLLVGSILSTFVPYCGLVVLFFGAGLLLRKAESVAPASLLLAAAVFLGRVYLLLVAAHLLGRFYFRYDDRLRWEA